MATFEGTIENGQIIVVFAVSISGVGGKPYYYNALLDTGVQATMISNEVAKAPVLVPIGHLSILGVTGALSHIQKYRAKIDIRVTRPAIYQDGVVEPHEFMNRMDVEVDALPYSPFNSDVFLEMNFFSGFHITMFGNRFSVTFSVYVVCHTCKQTTYLA